MQINLKFVVSLFFLILLFSSCNEYTPKPIGYNRIESIETVDVEYCFTTLSFAYSNKARIDTLQSKGKDEIWFNIVYPKYNAVVYCTYLPISKKSLPKILDDSYKLAYSHSVKADEINQKIYSNPISRVFATVYSIEGDVATPIQFHLTDSLSHFFRGSFYYNEKVNTDSIAPITEFVLNDVQNMMNSFAWKKK